MESRRRAESLGSDDGNAAAAAAAATGCGSSGLPSLWPSLRVGLPVAMVGPLHLRSDVTGRLAPVLALLQGGALYLQPEEDRTLPPLRHTLALTDALVSTPANDYMRASRAGASGRITLKLGSDEWEMQAPTPEAAAEWVVQLGSAIPLARIPRRYGGALDDGAAAAAGQGDSDGEDEASVSAASAGRRQHGRLCRLLRRSLERHAAGVAQGVNAAQAPLGRRACWRAADV